MHEYYGPDADLRGGAYPNPDDHRTTKAHEQFGKISTLDDEWTDTRIHLRMTDMADGERERALVVHMSPHDEAQVGEETWVVDRKEFRRRLLNVFSDARDDDWAVVSTVPVVNDIARTISTRLIDRQDIATEDSPFLPQDR